MPNSLSRARLARAVLVLGGGIVLLWLTMAITYAQLAARSDPASAHIMWPPAAEPRARLAEADVAAATTATSIAIRNRAQRVLLRDPLNVVAARSAGMAAALVKDDTAARRLIAYAQTLSRRDLGTQVTLIEFAVADGDVPAALHHYDMALRGSEAADPLLMPVLVQAARGSQIATALGPILAGRPPWRLRFIYNMLQARPWSPTFLPLLLSAQLSIDVPQEQDFLRRAVQGLVENGSINDATRLYTTATGTPPASGVRNGNFANEDRLAPFDWQLVDEPGFTALKGPVAGAPQGNVLSLVNEGARRGVIAKQLLRLRPGNYVLRFRAGAVPAGRDAAPVVQLACSNMADRVLASIVVPPAGLFGTSVSARLIVPRDCTAQWLTITTGTDDILAQDNAPWLGWFAVAPA